MNLFRQHKQAFTLIEVMVAFSLVALLLTIGFGAYSQMSLFEKEGDQLRHTSMQQRLAQSRLATLFLRVPEPDLYADAKGKSQGMPSRVFYSTDRAEPSLFMPGSLVFTYDNQTDLWPEFCNHVIARLYMKEGQGHERGGGKELWLTTWPRPECSMDPLNARHELLLDGVTGMSCRFYALPKLSSEESGGGGGRGGDNGGQASEPPAPAPAAGTWNNTWSIAYSQLPLVVNIKLELEDREGKKIDPLDFYFPLLNTGRVPILTDRG